MTDYRQTTGINQNRRRRRQTGTHVGSRSSSVKSINTFEDGFELGIRIVNQESQQQEVEVSHIAQSGKFSDLNEKTFHNVDGFSVTEATVKFEDLGIPKGETAKEVRLITSFDDGTGQEFTREHFIDIPGPSDTSDGGDTGDGGDDGTNGGDDGTNGGDDGTNGGDDGSDDGGDDSGTPGEVKVKELRIEEASETSITATAVLENTSTEFDKTFIGTVIVDGANDTTLTETVSPGSTKEEEIVVFPDIGASEVTIGFESQDISKTVKLDDGGDTGSREGSHVINSISASDTKPIVGDEISITVEYKCQGGACPNEDIELFANGDLLDITTTTQSSEGQTKRVVFNAIFDDPGQANIEAMTTTGGSSRSITIDVKDVDDGTVDDGDRGDEDGTNDGSNNDGEEGSENGDNGQKNGDDEESDGGDSGIVGFVKDNPGLVAGAAGIVGSVILSK